MSSANSSAIKNKQKLKKTIAKLSAIGLINYTPTQPLTKGQLTWVINRANKYAHLLKKPEDFKVAKVSKTTAKELKACGYDVTIKDRAIIPLKGFKSAKISRGKLKFDGVTPGGAKITETVTLSTAKDFYSKLEKLNKKKLKRNQYLTVKIGDNAEFKRKFTNYEDLYNYITYVFEPKDRGQTKAKIMRYMSIVELEILNVKKSTSTKGTPIKAVEKRKK